MPAGTGVHVSGRGLGARLRQRSDSPMRTRARAAVRPPVRAAGVVRGFKQNWICANDHLVAFGGGGANI